MQSHFVDWKKPFLSGVVELILEQNALGAVKDNLLDLSGFIFVFPSGLAIRSFEEKLARGAEKLIGEGKLRADWLPPKDVIPVGEFSERLYEPEAPFAEKPALLLAWRTALCENPESAKDVFPNLPAAGDFSGMLEVAALLARLHEEVAQEGLDFSSPREYAKQNVSKEEVVRWNALCEIQKSYYKTLAARGMCDKQKERLNAVRDNRIRTDKTVVLVGAADLNNLQKKIIGKVGDRAVAFVQAPEEEKCLFDEYGCVKSEAWENYEIGIPHDTSIVAAPDTLKEGEYAACYTHLWGAEGTEFRRGQVAVSLCDPAPRPYLSEKLAELGIEPHFGEGKPFASSRVALLLRGAADYLRTQSYDSFAAWIRHPDVEAALGRNSQKQGNSRNTLTCYDKHQDRRIPQKIVFSGSLPDAVRNSFRKLLGLPENHAVSHDDPDRKAPLSGHLARIDEFLQYFYPEKVPLDGETESAQIDEGLRILYEALDLVRANVPCGNCELTAAEAVDFVLRCASGQIRVETSDDAADITGWLDARFAETPHLILAGLNEGIVPESRISDLFLPDTVRTDVGIENNRRRYARDAYYLTAIVRRLTDEGKDGLRILFARTEDDGTPIPPSRLLFAENEEKIAQRVRRFFGGRDGSQSDSDGQISPEEGELAAYFTAPPDEAPDSAAPVSEGVSPFALPVIPLSGDPPKEMNVTDLSSYSFLESPYKYFLQKIYGLETLGDSSPEIQSNTFGTIVHNILHEFGRSDKKHSTDEDEIREFLCGELDKTVEDYKKASAAGTALLQLELIRRRLEGFARWQARWRGLGNEIVAVEEDGQIKFGGEGDCSDPKGFTLILNGRIDRIDYNRKLKQWFVFDYKTFDKADENKGGDSEDLKIRLAPFFPGNEESSEEGADSGGTPETDGFPAVNIKVNNTADQQHRNDKQKIFPPELVRDVKHWTNLQLPLYTLLAEEIIKNHGSEFPRGNNSLIPGYILLKKDNSCEASLAGWSEEEIDGAILTARWVCQTIVRIWKEGKADPNALLDPQREELGHLYEPDGSDWNNKKKSRDVLRDFPD